MAVLPLLPKPLRSLGAADAREQARRVDEWAKGQQALSRALRDGNPSILRRLDELEARPVGGGGGSFPGYGSHVDLTIGGAGTDGSNTTVSRSDHTHGLPAFGDGAGEIAEGDHTHPGLGDGYYEKWDPDAVPETPHADDDECAGASIDASWTAWDVAAYTTRTANPTQRYYLFEGTGNGNTRWAGLYKAVPNNTFSITAMVTPVSYSPGTSGAIQIGVFVGDLTNTSTGDFISATSHNVAVLQGSPGGGQFRHGVHTAYNVAETSTLKSTGCRYVRLRVNGTTVTADCSPDGERWDGGQTGTATFTPTHVGICFKVVTNAVTAAGRVHWVRFQSGAGSDAFNLRTGRLVRIPVI